MKLTVKLRLTLAVIVTSIALLWFLLGETGFFIGITTMLGPFIFALVWIPALVLLIISIMKLKRGKMTSGIEYATAMIFLSLILFLTANPIKLLIAENVTRDWAQVTSDGKYEYRIELINRGQRNSRARLHIKNLLTGEEKTISVDKPTEGFASGEGSIHPQPDPSWMMSNLAPTETEHLYFLTTQSRVPRIATVTGKFEIDMKTGIATEILRKTHHQTHIRRIVDEDEQIMYAYHLQLIDTYQGGERTNF